MHLCFDIETIPSPIPPDPFKVQPRAGLKDPVKIAEDVQRKAKKEWADQAFDPMMGSILTIGFAPPDTFDGDNATTWWPPPERVTENRILNARYTERQLLEWLEQLIRDKGISSLVTWGGAEFDIPWLVKRAMCYKMTWLANKLFTLPHHDLLKVWTMGARQKRDEECFALDHVARGLGGQRPWEDIGGGGVFEALKMNDLQSIDHHLRWDIKDLCLVGSRLQACGIWDPSEKPRRW